MSQKINYEIRNKRDNKIICLLYNNPFFMEKNKLSDNIFIKIKI